MSPRAAFASLAALRRDRRGNSIVEMSLILPVMVLLTCGALDLGLAFLGQIRIQQARLAHDGDGTGLQVGLHPAQHHDHPR